MTDAKRRRPETDGASPFRRRPARTSGAVAVALAAVAVALVADGPVQRRVLAVALVGVAVFVAGGTLWRRERSVALAAVAVVVAVAGTLVVVAALGLGLTRPPRYVDRIELLPGVAGLWLLAAGLVPLRIGSERSLVDAGTGLTFLAVMAGGVIQSSPPRALLLAGVLTVIAWDVAENAISIGGQVGAAAETARAEAVHAAGTGVVGVAAVGTVLFVDEMNVDGIPFAGLVAMLVAGVALALFYNR